MYLIAPMEGGARLTRDHVWPVQQLERHVRKCPPARFEEFAYGGVSSHRRGLGVIAVLDVFGHERQQSVHLRGVPRAESDERSRRGERVTRHVSASLCAAGQVGPPTLACNGGGVQSQDFLVAGLVMFGVGVRAWRRGGSSRRFAPGSAQCSVVTFEGGVAVLERSVLIL